MLYGRNLKRVLRQQRLRRVVFSNRVNVILIVHQKPITYMDKVQHEYENLNISRPNINSHFIVVVLEVRSYTIKLNSAQIIIHCGHQSIAFLPKEDPNF